MTIDDNRGGSFQKNQNQYDVIYVQPHTQISFVGFVTFRMYVQVHNIFLLLACW